MTDAPKITIGDIVEAVAAHYAMTPIAIRSPRQDSLVAQARHVVFWFAGAMTDLSNVAIGRALGDRDHATVLRGRERIADLRNDQAVRDVMDGIEAAIIVMARLRERKIVPAPRHIDPYEVAHRVATGDERAAGVLSIAEIAAVCETLEALQALHAPQFELHRLRQAAGEVVEARREQERALYSPAERSARARFECALKALSKQFSTNEVESTHA